MTRLEDNRKEILRQIRVIKNLAGVGDSEAAHGDEIRLWAYVLELIATGKSSDAHECARLALTTRRIKFARFTS